MLTLAPRVGIVLSKVTDQEMVLFGAPRPLPHFRTLHNLRHFDEGFYLKIGTGIRTSLKYAFQKPGAVWR